MLKILSLDPSGTGTTGICLINQKITFKQFQSKEWLKHLDFIRGLAEEWEADLILYENTNYLHAKTQDGLSLFRLLGALEALPIRTEHILVSQVKELKKQLFKGTKQISELTFKPGKGWFYQKQKISVHQLDAFLVYLIWKERRRTCFESSGKEKHA